MTLMGAIAVCRMMQYWIKNNDGTMPMPRTPEQFEEAINVLIDLAESFIKFKDNLKKVTEE